MKTMTQNELDQTLAIIKEANAKLRASVESGPIREAANQPGKLYVRLSKLYVRLSKLYVRHSMTQNELDQTLAIIKEAKSKRSAAINRLRIELAGIEEKKQREMRKVTISAEESRKTVLAQLELLGVDVDYVDEEIGAQNQEPIDSDTARPQ